MSELRPHVPIQRQFKSPSQIRMWTGTGFQLSHLFPSFQAQGQAEGSPLSTSRPGSSFRHVGRHSTLDTVFDVKNAALIYIVVIVVWGFVEYWKNIIINKNGNSFDPIIDQCWSIGPTGLLFSFSFDQSSAVLVHLISSATFTFHSQSWLWLFMSFLDSSCVLFLES